MSIKSEGLRNSLNLGNHRKSVDHSSLALSNQKHATAAAASISGKQVELSKQRLEENEVRANLK